MPPPISTPDMCSQMDRHLHAYSNTCLDKYTFMFRGYLFVAMSGNQRVGSFTLDANGWAACAESMHKCSRQ